MSIQIFDASNKINKLIEEHKQFVLTNNFLHKEFTLNEYQQMIKNIEEKMLNPPEDKIKPTDEFTTRQMLKDAYVNLCKREIELLNRDMKRLNDFNSFIESEKIKASKYPKSTDDVIRNMKEFINEKISYYHKDLISSYFDMFVDKVKKLTKKDKDYTKTIESVYRCKNSKTAMNIILKFMDSMKNSLIKMSMNVKNSDSVEFYKMESILKSQCLKLIEKIHYVIYKFIEQQINYIDDEEEMNESKVVKLYAESCISQLNQVMMKELPEILNEEFMVCVEDRMEDLSYIWRNQIGCDFVKNKSLTQNVTTKAQDEDTTIVEINNKPLVAEVIEVKTQEKNKDFNSFLNLIPNESVEVNELTEMYNNYFGVNISSRGLGMMRNIKDSFTKESKIIKGKRVTTYQKK